MTVPRIMPKPRVLSPIPKYKIMDKAIVDDEQWYTIRVYRPEIMQWINEQPSDWQVELKDMYPHGRQWDVHEKLYMILTLRWA